MFHAGRECCVFILRLEFLLSRSDITCLCIYTRNFVTLFRDDKISDGIFASDRFRAIHISAENSAPLKIDTITGVLQQRGMFKRLPRLNVSTFSLGENYFDKILEKYLVLFTENLDNNRTSFFEKNRQKELHENLIKFFH